MEGADTRLVVAGRGGVNDTVLLRGLTGARFAYLDRAGSEVAWPPAADERRSLRAVTLAATSAHGPIAIAAERLWIEQPPDCAFDPILEDCRSRAP